MVYGLYDVQLDETRPQSGLEKKRIEYETKRRKAVFFSAFASLWVFGAALWDGSRGMMLDADEETLYWRIQERPWWSTAVPSPLRAGTGAVHWRPKASTR